MRRALIRSVSIEAKVARYWREAWTEGDVGYLETFYAPTFRQNDEVLTPADFGTAIVDWRRKFPDFAVSVDRTFSWPGGIGTRVTYTGTHLGDFKVLPATGRTIRVGGLDIFEFDEQDLVVRHWHETDHYDMFVQLGATVGPGD